MKKILLTIAILLVGVGLFAQPTGVAGAWEFPAAVTIKTNDLTLTNGNFILKSGAKISFDSDDVTLTHSANTLTVAGGSLVLPSGTAASTKNINDSIQVYLADAEEVVALADSSSIASPNSYATGFMLQNHDYLKKALESLSVTYKGMPVSQPFVTGQVEISENTVYLTAIYVPSAVTITGIKIISAVAGAYTADNYNGIGLYSVSGTTYTLVASSADDGDIWKTAAYNVITKAFSSAYVADAGLYFVAILFNNSATTTTPQVFGNLSSAITPGYITGNNHKLAAYWSGQNTLPATISVSSSAGSTAYPMFVWAY